MGRKNRGIVNSSHIKNFFHLGLYLNVVLPQFSAFTVGTALFHLSCHFYRKRYKTIGAETLAELLEKFSDIFIVL